MQRVDKNQFTVENKMLFQDGDWYLFEDIGNFDAPKQEYYPRTAHRCNPETKFGNKGNWYRNSTHKCCLVVTPNGNCRDCNAPIPETFFGFYRLVKWSYETR